uniref:Card1-like endonuclease domain-containing protein n=1 Tax=Thomasclavelia spiroformis TaxID=29348 RepID=UPI00320B2FE9
KLDGRKIKADISMFNTLAKIGALINLEIYDDRICFNYYDETIENLINQQGSFLEVYTYLQLYNSKQFDEIKINTIIDWDKDDENKIINEVDVIARIGRKLYFISCKTSELKTEYLNEIYVITKRFGLKESFPVIVTTTDIDERTSLIYERARKLDCIIIDKDDIKKGNLVSKLLSVY